MKIGLLLCDNVHESLQSTHGNYPGMFESLLKKQDPDIEMITYRVIDHHFPDDISECDHWIISGSRHSANDEFSWIRELERFVQKLYIKKRKLAGICFGHQVIARALGGKVVHSEKGWGVGVSENRMIQKKSWVSSPPDSLNLLVSHQDQVSKLPESTEVIASSDFCPYYMLQYGQCFISVQGHPEFSKKYSADLMTFRRDTIPDDRIEQGFKSLALEVDSDTFCQWLLNFFNE